ncbi:MAG: phytanoyl-CoA dioxygenase family protein [Myxococcota bacterium]|nr:phytanoyl-CoA dioxygenase family protein [Myxococcota bacterium]
MTTPAISAEQRRAYDRDGYLLVRGLFTPPELKPWLERLSDIAEERVAPAPGMTVMRDVMVAKGAVEPGTRLEAIAKIQDFHGDPVLFSYAAHPRLLDRVEAFCGPDVKSIHNMLINKPPGVDGRHPLHQDLLYFPFRPADAIVGTWTALEPATRENGCLVVVPGTHRGELLPHENPDWEYLNLAYFGVKDVDASARVHLEMEPGDTVLFHPLLVHGSGRNRTSGFRRAISAHYASAGCRYLDGGHPLAGRRPYRLVRGVEHPGCI